MRTFEDFISYFKVIRRRGDTCDCLCTGHEDKQPSLQITQDGNKILVHCKAGCKASQVMEGAGLSMADLFLHDDHDVDRKKPASAMLKLLAAQKGFPEDFLLGLGVKQLKYFVRITYKLEDGSLALRQRIRFALVAKDGSKWESGKGKPVPYGLWRLDEARKAGYLCIVEGESDSWTLWFHGFPALGLPGAEMAGTLEASYLRGISKIYVMQEPDKGGDSFVSGIGNRLKKIGWKGDVFILQLEGVKDPNELHKQNPDEFKMCFQAALDSAKPLDNNDQQNSCEIVDDIPDIIRRPLCIIKGIAYGASWLWIKTTVHETVQKNGSIEKHDPPLIREEQVLAIIRGSDAALFSDAAVPDAQPISKLGLSVILPEIPSADRIWSGAGVKRYLSGDRPNPDEVFRRLVEVVDQFMDFSRSLSNQQKMCELMACSVLATYLLDAFNVIGYQWPNGEKGTAKTKFLLVFCELAYLGLVVLAGGSYASLRDLADYGATLAFDDCEAIMDPNRSDPDKRALLLAGNRRGAMITVKEAVGKRGWTTRQVNAFCPRLFSAIRLPDEILGSRTIVVPLVRSGDEKKVNADPLAPEMWPHDRRLLIDDLWAVAVTHLPKLKPYNSQVPQLAQLKGRDLEPWRALLAVAMWLQEEHGVSDLFVRMEELSREYQKERDDFSPSDLTRLAIAALRDLFSKCRDAESAGCAELDVTTSEVAARINQLAVDAEMTDEGEKLTTPARTGFLLKRLRLQRADRTAKNKRWKLSCRDLDALASSYGIKLEMKCHAEPGTLGKVGNPAPNGKTNHPALSASTQSADVELVGSGREAFEV